MKRIISVLLAVLILSSVFVMPASAVSSQYAEGKYADEFEQYLKDLGYSIENENDYEYFEMYEYYAQGNNTHIPDWILAGGYIGEPIPAGSNGIFGKYNLVLGNLYNPRNYYYIYVPSESKFYTLSDAWTKKIGGIEKAFTDYLEPNGYAELIEDSDGDDKITYIDAEKYVNGFTFYNSYDLEENCIYFDANTTDWKDYDKVYCHIWEAGGDMFHEWQSKKELCVDDDKDGIWAYNLYKAGIYLYEGKEYYVIFSNEKQEQIYHLAISSKNIGGTVQLSGRFAETESGTLYNIPMWKSTVLHFDTNTTGWEDFNRIYCHIYEYGGDSFFNWQSKKQRCEDTDGDGIWTYDLESKGIELENGKLYGVIFSSDKGNQTYNLLFDKTVLGDTAYCDDTRYTSPEDSDKEVLSAFWRNQDKNEFGPEMVILVTGEVVGTCIPRVVTEEDMFKEFMVNKLLNAQTFSGKTDQQLIDDIAKVLGFTANEVEFIFNELEIYWYDCAWRKSKSTLPKSNIATPDQLDVHQVVRDYKEESGDKFETKRYYFLMPNVIVGSIPEEEERGESWTWYNKYAESAYIHWDGTDRLDLEGVGNMAMVGDTYDVYYADVPDFVTSIHWNNGVEVNGYDDPMLEYAHRTENIMCEYYDVGESETYPDGLDSFENMIYVLEKGAQSFGNPVAYEKGEWYYYYGDECYGTKENGERLDCINPYHYHYRKQSASEAQKEYEAQTGEKVETNRYYFLMPNGSNGELGKLPDEEHFNKFADTWYNEYNDGAGIYWWKSQYFNPGYPGYTMEKTNVSDVYYADVPKDVKDVDFNNLFEIITDTDYEARATKYVTAYCEGYAAGENENYPDGIESFDNMIYVAYPDYRATETRIIDGEWYYHYGNGCYGTVKDGKTADCIRDDHDHSDRFIHFDANTTNWRYYEKIYCHIWEYGEEPFYNWQQRAELCTDNDGDGIWTYDLAEHGIELEEGKQYAVIFSNENGYQTFNLLFDTTVLGDTAYCDGERYENQDGGSRNPEFAYWRNQDDSEAGPEMRINMIGEVTGTCIPKGKTAYDLFKDFLENNFENAQIYSGKTDQQLLDDLAKALKLSSNDVERALKETGIKDVDWKHPDKLSVNDAVTNYEEKTGENVDTIRYYFLMPNGKNGQLKTDTVGGNPYASSWYNTYADKPGVYWWDVKSYDPPRFPGYYIEKSDSKDVYYADLPKEVKEVIWNNFIFASMDTIDDPMYAYSCQTKETVLPHQIYSSMPNEEPSFIYVVDPDTENTSEFSGKKTIDGNWYYYYGNGCYGNTYGGECIRGDHDHTIRDTYIVAGVEALCGSSWDLFDTNNQMTFNKKTGAYEITYTDVPVGNHEFMVTKNFEFGPITPGNPDYNEAKVTVDGSIVKITYTEGVGVSVEVTPPLLGDVDGDGVISIMDATEIQLAVAKKITLTEEQEKYADTDFDKEVSVMDATAIQLFVAKKITEFK